MSTYFACGLDAAKPIAELSAKHGTTALWIGLPKLCVVLIGGFTTNFIWCVILNFKNRTGYQYFSSTIRTESQDKNHSSEPAAIRAPMLNNYLFSALAGVTWYMQFFFYYTMGETQMGNYKFSSWTIHMASIIIFSSLWGIALHEWKGSSVSTKKMLAIGLITLVLSTIVVGYGNFLGVVGTK
jgi:L-rhamnose-H+ transport protein